MGKQQDGVEWDVLGVFFFFKQKTAYEIYQCDWSSDVCSSDLGRAVIGRLFAASASQEEIVGACDQEVGLIRIAVGERNCDCMVWSLLRHVWQDWQSPLLIQNSTRRILHFNVTARSPGGLDENGPASSRKRGHIQRLNQPNPPSHGKVSS